MTHTREEKIEALGRVIDTLDILRVKCPWDAKQTNESLRPNTIEEVYELCDALINEDNTNIRKELGDVLLHVLFYSKIGEEKGAFDIADVCDALNTKLIYRHPHVFGDTSVSSTDEVLQNWEELKLKEKGGNKTVLSGVPTALPAMIKADRIQEKAANVGFDWEKPGQIWDNGCRASRRGNGRPDFQHHQCSTPLQDQSRKRTRKDQQEIHQAFQLS